MWIPKSFDIQPFKRINQIKSDTYDEYYTAMLPLMVEHVEEYIIEQCNGKAFERDETGKPILTSSIVLFIAKAIQHSMVNVGISSRSMGSVSYSYSLDFPKGLYTQYLPKRMVKFHASR